MAAATLAAALLALAMSMCGAKVVWEDSFPDHPCRRYASCDESNAASECVWLRPPGWSRPGLPAGVACPNSGGCCNDPPDPPVPVEGCYPETCAGCPDGGEGVVFEIQTRLMQCDGSTVGAGLACDIFAGVCALSED